MAADQDALITLPHSRYGEYLLFVYGKMAEHVPPDADVAEIGVRPEDRGELSPEIIPHKTFRTYDRQDARGEHTADLLEDTVTADVILSTCILHHTPEEDVPTVLANMDAPTLLLSGPNVEELPELFGDHEWHIDIPKLEGWLAELGYRVSWERIGLSRPLCEVLVVAKR